MMLRAVYLGTDQLLGVTCSYLYFYLLLNYARYVIQVIKMNPLKIKFICK